MHVLYECLGHPAELDLAKHIRAMVDAALFLDDKEVLLNTLNIVNRVSQQLDKLKSEDLTAVIDSQEDCAYGEAMTAEEEWSALEKNSGAFDNLQHVLDAAQYKIKAAIAGIDRGVKTVIDPGDDYDDTDC